MGNRGSGGRIWSSVTGEWHDETPVAKPTGLSPVEVVCFGLAIGLIFYLGSQPDLANVLDPEIRRRMFVGRHPNQQLFISFATTLAIYFVALSFLDVPPKVRLAGSMLGTVVSVAVLYVSLVAFKSLLISAILLAVAPATALQSRCGVTRAAALRSTVLTAIVTCWVHSAYLHLF